MNTITLSSQLYFTNDKLIFWTKFYLLSNHDFRLKFAEGHHMLEKSFHETLQLSTPLNLDILTQNRNIDSLTEVIENFMSVEPFTNNKIASDFFHSYLTKDLDQNQARKLFSRYALEGERLNKHFTFLKDALQRRSFYNLSHANPTEFIGDWISVKESGQLRINYNMTDLTPIGTEIRLSIKRHDEAYYLFKCLAKAHDYRSRDVYHVNVFETFIKIEAGHFHHYRKDDMAFLFKRPAFNFLNDAFTTQTFDIEFRFKRLTGNTH